MPIICYTVLLKRHIIHVVKCFQGIIIGLDNLDGVIDIIKETSSNTMATAALMKGNIFYVLLGDWVLVCMFRIRIFS